jgi:hypothetical protein
VAQNIKDIRIQVATLCQKLNDPVNNFECDWPYAAGLDLSSVQENVASLGTAMKEHIETFIERMSYVLESNETSKSEKESLRTYLARTLDLLKMLNNTKKISRLINRMPKFANEKKKFIYRMPFFVYLEAIPIGTLDSRAIAYDSFVNQTSNPPNKDRENALEDYLKMFPFSTQAAKNAIRKLGCAPLPYWREISRHIFGGRKFDTKNVNVNEKLVDAVEEFMEFFKMSSKSGLPFKQDEWIAVAGLMFEEFIGTQSSPTSTALAAKVSTAPTKIKPISYKTLFATGAQKRLYFISQYIIEKNMEQEGVLEIVNGALAAAFNVLYFSAGAFNVSFFAYLAEDDFRILQLVREKDLSGSGKNDEPIGNLFDAFEPSARKNQNPIGRMQFCTYISNLMRIAIGTGYSPGVDCDILTDKDFTLFAMTPGGKTPICRIKSPMTLARLKSAAYVMIYNQMVDQLDGHLNNILIDKKDALSSIDYDFTCPPFNLIGVREEVLGKIWKNFYATKIKTETADEAEQYADYFTAAHEGRFFSEIPTLTTDMYNALRKFASKENETEIRKMAKQSGFSKAEIDARVNAIRLLREGLVNANVLSDADYMTYWKERPNKYFTTENSLPLRMEKNQGSLTYSKGAGQTSFVIKLPDGRQREIFGYNGERATWLQ